MSEILRVGILGAARIAPMALLGPARQTEGVVVSAIAARDPQRAAKFANKHAIEKVHESYDALLADPTVDAVYNPLPNSLHAKWTIRALDAKKHVLCEKPFTANAQEAEQVHARALASECVVMEAFHYRYHPLAERLNTLASGGELGALKWIETWMCIPLPLPGDIRYRLDLAGGATMDTGCYATHLNRTLAGEEPEIVSAHAKLASPGVDRRMTADVRYPSGATGRITCSLWSATLLKAAVHARFEQGEIMATNPIAPQFFHRMKWRKTGEPWVRERFSKKASYTYQLEAFRDAVQQGRPFPTTTEDAIKNMRALDGIYRAAGMKPRGYEA